MSRESHDDIPVPEKVEEDDQNKAIEPGTSIVEEKYTLCQWVERLSYRFLGSGFTSFVIRRRFVLTRLLIVFAYWLLGIEYYHESEGWDKVDAAYFITVTTTTVGYGDFKPSTDSTRLFTIFYAIFGIAFVLSAVIDLINYLIVRKLQTKVLNALGVSNMESRAWFKLIFSISCVLSMIAIGTIFFFYNEQWTVSFALYWTIITMLTIGYGDATINQESRKFSIWFIWTCVVIYIMAISNILDTVEELKNAALRKEILRAHRVDILDLLENDRRDRETVSDNHNTRGLLSWRHSLSSIYPTNASDEVKYTDSPIDLTKGDIELALSIGSSKPVISPIINHSSLKALFQTVESESTKSHDSDTSFTSSNTASTSSTSPAFCSRGSIEPTAHRNSSIASPGGSFYQGGDRRPSDDMRRGGNKRPSIFEDPNALQSKSDRFVLEMLIKMKKVDQERDIAPLVKHFEAIGLMREEHKDASKEEVAQMIVNTLHTNKSTLSSIAATLVGNKKIVVQKRASEIEKNNKRRESSDPRSEQGKPSFKNKAFPLGSAPSRSESIAVEDSIGVNLNAAVSGSDSFYRPPDTRRNGSVPFQSFNAIAEGEEDDDG